MVPKAKLFSSMCQTASDSFLCVGSQSSVVSKEYLSEQELTSPVLAPPLSVTQLTLAVSCVTESRGASTRLELTDFGLASEAAENEQLTV